MTSDAVTSAPAAAPGQLRRVARGSALNLAGAGISAAANFALVVVLTRGLPKASAGIFFTATSIFLVGSVLARMGCLTGLVYFVARLRNEGRTGAIRQCLRVALRPVAGAGTIAALAVVVAGFVVRSTATASTATTLSHELWVLAPFLPVAALSDSLLAATRGFGSMRSTVLIENVARVTVQFGLCLAVVAVTARPEPLALAYGLPYLGSASWAALRVRRLAGPRTAAGTQEPGLRRQFWRFTAPRALASVAQMLLQRLDIVLVATLRGPGDAAVYTAATRLLVAGQMAGQAITTATQPRLAATLSAGQHDEARHTYQSATAWLVLLTWPVYLLFIVDAGFLLRIFGAGYSGAAVVVVILAASMLVATGCGMVDVVLTMGGRTSWNLANTIGALIVNVAVDVALVPRYGITGAAIGWAAAIVVNNVVPLAQIWWVQRLHPFGGATVAAMAGTLVLVGVGPGAVAVAAPHHAMAAIVAAVAALALFAGFVWQRRYEFQLNALVPTMGKRRGAAR